MKIRHVSNRGFCKIKAKTGFMIFFLVVGCAQTESQAPEQNVFLSLVGNGECDEATNYLGNNFDGFDYYLLLGVAYHRCRNNESRAIEIWEMGARMGDARAAELLQNFGVTPPRPAPPPLPPVRI